MIKTSDDTDKHNENEENIEPEVITASSPAVTVDETAGINDDFNKEL